MNIQNGVTEAAARQMTATRWLLLADAQTLNSMPTLHQPHFWHLSFCSGSCVLVAVFDPRAVSATYFASSRTARMPASVEEPHYCPKVRGTPVALNIGL
jgi:hypothetical protein